MPDFEDPDAEYSEDERYRKRNRYVAVGRTIQSGHQEILGRNPIRLTLVFDAADYV